MNESKGRYQPEVIEPKWQKFWLDNRVFEADDFSEKPKFYVLDMFPYPSGSGLHVGHPEGYTATDMLARYKRMRGYNVLHPMGWDAFGLPAEQYAIETGTHPKETTKKNIDRFREQIRSFGFSYDWSREINTTDPGYYRWTQWIFLQLHKKGLAYLDEVPVNWCPALGTVLANEEVIDGRSERGGHPVVRKPMKQWMLKITEYAERLLADLDELDWPEGIKEMQRNWIGKSVGAEVDFKVVGTTAIIRVFTTRPDTLFGATYMVLAPEHPLTGKLTSDECRREVDEYIFAASNKSDLDRTELSTEKTGVFIGAYAFNPVNNEEIPIWISDYVMMGYGTGAIMAVPAHDSRDFEFATKFGIEIRAIIEPSSDAASDESITSEDVLAGRACWTRNGRMIRSSNDRGLDINGMPIEEAKAVTIDWLANEGFGISAINYKLRDWLFSRQRYWGEPFPVIHMDDGEIKLLSDDDLPVTLPELTDFHPAGNGQSPLANAVEWCEYVEPESGRVGRRETHTMPQWAGSCWYYLRYIDPNNASAPWEPAKEEYWMPVDLYVGGAEHAVLHLLYARFWHKVLYDLGYVSTKEPFKKLINQGMILGTSYKNSDGALIPTNLVTQKDGKFHHVETGEHLEEFPAKMSKSLRNVVNPDNIIAEYGADSFRLYEMFMGPLEAVKPWNTSGVEGVRRFLLRAWRMIIGSEGAISASISDISLTRKQEDLLHFTIKKVTGDIESLDINTAISQLMIFVNEFSKLEARNKVAMEIFVKLLGPLAPHIAEEMWQRMGHDSTLAYEAWPSYDEERIGIEELEILVQILGKPKVRLVVPARLSADETEKFVLSNSEVTREVAGRTIKKVICVPGRLVNIVVAR